MKTIKMFRMTMFALVGCLSVSAFADGPTVSDVKVRQRWPWSRLVDIDYVLTCETTQATDMTVTGYNGLTAFELPAASLSGDLCNVTQGKRRIVWDPTKTACVNDMVTQFRVELTPIPAPLYMIVDLTNAVPLVEYVYEEDLVTNKWGAWEEDFVKTNGVAVVKSVIWTDVTNNPTYKKEKLVLRRIPAGRFGMGTALVDTPVDKVFYAGVFEVTQEQWKNVTGTYPACWQTANRLAPRETVKYNDIRGATNSVPRVDWPETGSYVHPLSFIFALRTKTGIDGFDLPTEAQWEFLCRAGTTTSYNDGLSTYNLPQLGWFGGNSGSTTHTVGEKTPNAWGLYDTHGNVYEWCLDWYSPTNDRRVTRGGCWGGGYGSCASGYRTAASFPPSASDGYSGFRLVRTWP